MRRLPFLLLVLAPLVALWPGLTGLAVGPFDAIRQMAPWNGPKPAQPWDVLMADSVLQSHVWRTLVLDAWGKGQLPLWNPYESAGTPLLANSQSGGFYPPHILLGLLHVPAGFAGFLLAWFHLALAGLGTYALVRRLGGSAAGSLTAGLAFTLSPFLLGWAPLSSVPATLAWTPLALACVAANDRRSFLALAACVGMTLLGGHLQFAAYALMAVVTFALVRLPLSKWLFLERGLGGEEESLLPLPPAPSPRRATWKGGVPLLLALALGGALAAPQLLPVLEYSKESHRRNVPTEEGYTAYLGSALRPFELANLAHPFALGDPREPVEVGGQTISTYWPALVKPGANWAESAVGIGSVVFALLFAVPWRRRETWPLVAVGGVSLLLALGTPLDRLLYFLLPGWSSTGSPARVEILFVLCACALAGLSVDRITERKAQILAAVGAVVGMLLAVALPNLLATEGAAAALRGSATADAMLPILGATALTVLVLFAAKRTLWAVPTGVILVALLGHAATHVPFGQPLAKVAGDPDARIAVVNDAWDLLVAPPALMPPNLAALSGLHELSGYDSLTSRDAVEMLRGVNGGTDPAPPANGNLMFVKPSLDPKALAECGVTEVWSRRELPGLGNSEPRDGYLAYPLPGTLADYSRGPVRLRDDYESVRASWGVSNDGGDLRVRVRAEPGWEAWEAGGRGVALQPGRWLDVRGVESGAVTFRYHPPGLRAGLWIGAFAWLGLILILFTNARYRKVTPSEASTS